MVRPGKESLHGNRPKHSRKRESSTDSSSASSSNESPPRHRKSLKSKKDVEKDRRREIESPVKRKAKETRHGPSEKKSHKSHNPSSSEDESPPRHKKIRNSQREEPQQYKHNKNESPERTKKHHRSKEERRSHEKRHENVDFDRREKRDRRKSEENSVPAVKIKKEDDFDKRQEELRRKRKRDERRGDNQRSSNNVRIKEEPQSNDDTRNRNRERQRDGSRPKRREDIERERRENDARRAEAWQQREREGGQNAEALREGAEEEPKEKEKPNLGLSGALTEDTNTFRGVVIKYSEPHEARVPSKKWRLYPFKGDEALKVLHLHRQSAYLLGKLRRIADIPIDHPSCSKQHAVLQFRLVEEEKEDGTKKRIVKPYIIDLDSANGTFVNNNKIQPRRYVELKEKDVLKFAYSSREYVLIHDKSDTAGVESSGVESEED